MIKNLSFIAGFLLISMVILSTKAANNINYINTDSESYYDWDNVDTKYVLYTNIFVGEILEIIDTYQKNEEDILSARNIPITHFKVRVYKDLKGTVKSEIIDLFFYGGINDKANYMFYDYTESLPKIGETYIIFTTTPTDSMISVDTRLFAGVYENQGRPDTMIMLNGVDLESIKEELQINEEIIKVVNKIEETKHLSNEDVESNKNK